MTSTLSTPENYVMSLGKYKGMKVIDIAKIRLVDKFGIERPAGLRYLRWLSTQDWFGRQDVIKQILSQVGGEDEEEDIKPKVQKKVKNQRNQRRLKLYRLKRARMMIAMY